MITSHFDVQRSEGRDDEEIYLTTIGIEKNKE